MTWKAHKMKSTRSSSKRIGAFKVGMKVDSPFGVGYLVSLNKGTATVKVHNDELYYWSKYTCKRSEISFLDNGFSKKTATAVHSLDFLAETNDYGSYEFKKTMEEAFEKGVATTNAEGMAVIHLEHLDKLSQGHQGVIGDLATKGHLFKLSQ